MIVKMKMYYLIVWESSTGDDPYQYFAGPFRTWNDARVEKYTQSRYYPDQLEIVGSVIDVEY